MSRKYELMYILSPTLDEESNKALHDKINDLLEKSGSVESVDHWGRKRLAYPIEDQTEGDYCVVLFTAEPEVPEEVQRVLKIADGVMRYMIISAEK